MRRWFIGALAAGLAASAGGAWAQDDLTIAVTGPLTGLYAAYGLQMKAGAEQAVEDINARGGVNGKLLRLVAFDDACDREAAMSAARSAIAQNAVLVAGHFCSSASILAAPLYAKAGVVQISPASSSPKLTDERAGPGVFRIAGRDDQQGVVAGRFLAARFAGKRIAILHDRTIYGQGIATAVKQTLNRAGITEAFNGVIRPGEKDYAEVIAKVQGARIEAIFFGGYHTEAAILIRQMREQGVSATLLGSDTLVTQEYWQLAGAAGQGTLMTFLPDARTSPAAADVMGRLRAKDVEPGGYVLYAYAAIEAWAAAVAGAQSSDAEAVERYLAANSVATVLGPVRFDAKGDSDLPAFRIYEWRDGAFQQID
jgi:branched-chain amino acid transport system substrate-binding protein